MWKPSEADYAWMRDFAIDLMHGGGHFDEEAAITKALKEGELRANRKKRDEIAAIALESRQPSLKVSLGEMVKGRK